MASDPFADYVDGEAFPGMAANDRTELEDYIRSTVVTAQDPACTCRMGRIGKEVAVFVSAT